jgi:hypothetical protein
VMARGLSGLLEQQGNVEDLQFVLQSVTSVADKVDPTTGENIVPPETIPALLSKIFEAKGIDASGIFNRDYTLLSALKGTTADQSNSQIGGFQQSNMGRDAAMAAAAKPAAPLAAPVAPQQAGPTP